MTSDLPSILPCLSANKIDQFLFAKWLPRESRGSCRSYRDNREQAQIVTKSAGEIDATD
jgi:hypothetical protein